MNAMVVQALVRHILTALAGGFAVKYGISSDIIDAIVGGGAALAGVGWSVYDKRKQS